MRLLRGVATQLTCALIAGAVQLAVAQEAPPAETTAPAARAQVAPLPAEARFDAPVSFRTGPEGEALSAMLQALARSVGLTAITQGVPDTVVRYDIGEPKPFREIWEIVLSLNGLTYVLRDPDIVVIGPPSVLAGLFETRTEARETRDVRTYAVNSSPEQLAAFLAAQFASESVDVTAFEELGLISVRGAPAQQERVAELLERYDRSKVARVRRVYPLSYARASNLAGVLLGTIFSTNTLGSSEQRSVTDLCSTADLSTPQATNQGAVNTEGVTPIPNSEALETPSLAISADPRTNQLIVTAPVSIQEEIAELIKTLDRPERQINVQVRIQEVSANASERLGLNLTAAMDRFSTTLFSGEGGLSFVFDAQRAIAGFNLGAILDVYEEQGLSRRVDDSNVTVLNNGVATLQAGGTQYNYVRDEAGGVTRDEIPYGVIVGFTPQVANNNSVILDLCARVDTPSLRDAEGRITEFLTRKANSRITLQPGQTVVLGGLLQNQVVASNRSVPGLGDIPVVGNLFSTNTATELNTELLIIVTANVLE
ncbi:type II secretion system protein GspD [Truepera radiovictrix]|uniref:type II secretion system protein GspD n=1 Tax=Truepera radiovictrix TaxID=332249 RepID=UPI0016119889|nr:secretin N-terminal domain-containing protein [Truepera radiovictrix]WMT56991.1 secretin N-terminal domain-containing protein [Truepera radiovictrix]